MSYIKHTIALIGNPNSGKTTFFNALTGAHQQVGNWPGVTIERKSGYFVHEGHKIEVIDLPGLYSLDTTDSSVSLDEQVARDYVLSGEADVIVNIVDASNLERNLFLTTQLLEMDVPVIVALNMVDVAETRGMALDTNKLQQEIGCPVFQIIASQGQGVAELKNHLATSENFKLPAAQPVYPPAMTQAVNTAIPNVAALCAQRQLNPHWAALKALEGDHGITQLLTPEQKEAISQLREQTEIILGDDIDIVTADARYAFIGKVVHDVITRKQQVSKTTSDKIDHIVLNRFLGIPIFLLLMYLMFLFTINLGGAFIDFFDKLFGTLLVDGLGHGLEAMGCPQWLKVVLANGIGGGIQTVSTFVPVIGFLFIFLSILEDSGYMARAAFVMDRFMRFIGLPGKSFVPLIVGFGCNVPAVMATRTLESRRDRMMTMAMAPFMSCGARLPIYALFAVAFFPSGGQNLVFGLYLIGVAAAVLTGLALKHTLLPGQGMPFIMELPPYHLPTVKGILRHTWDRLKSFVLRASKVIIPMVMVLNILNSVGTDGSFGHEDSQESALSAIGQAITPVFHPLGVTDENWPAAVGIFTGLLAKEAVVGTLNALYAQAGQEAAAEEGGAEPEPFSLWGGVVDAFKTIPTNLIALKDSLLDPLGLGAVKAEGSLEEIAEGQEVSVATYGAMVKMFPSTAAAFAYLLLVLLYFPCVAVIGAIAREASLRWAGFVAFWSTALGYCVAVLFYQTATFAQHPVYSASWIIGILVFMAVVLLVMRQYGLRHDVSDAPEHQAKTQGA